MRKVKIKVIKRVDRQNDWVRKYVANIYEKEIYNQIPKLNTQLCNQKIFFFKNVERL